MVERTTNITDKAGLRQKIGKTETKTGICMHRKKGLAITQGLLTIMLHPDAEPVGRAPNKLKPTQKAMS